MTLKVVELFSGIGAQRMALTRAGIPHEVVGISEVDRHALASYEAIWGDCPNLGDIRRVEGLPPCDLVTYSFPCQDLSLAGKRKGMGEGTRSGLVWEVARLLESAEERERPGWLLMENVPQVLRAPEWPSLVGRLEDMGYRNKWAVLDSSEFGSAQKRRRAFMASRLGADPPDLPLRAPNAPRLCLRDVMEPTREERFVKRVPLDRVVWREPKGERQDIKVFGCMDDDGRLDRGILPSRTFRQRRCYEDGGKAPTLAATDKVKVVSSTPIGEIEDIGKMYYKKSLWSPGQACPTICTDHGSNFRIKVVADWKRPGRLDQANRIYSEGGSCPGLVAHGGGNRDVKVVAEDLSEDQWKPHRLLMAEDGLSRTVGGYVNGSQRSIKVVAEDSSKAYAASAKILSSSSCPTLRSQVHGLQNQPKVMEGIEGVPAMEEGDVCPMLTPGRRVKRQNGRRFRDPDAPAYTVTAAEPNGAASVQGGDLVVSVLTPRECWRLMGFPEWAFNRASAVCSETQLYNQAGNSIVVEVLEAIFRAMFPPRPPRVQATIEEASA